MTFAAAWLATKQKAREAAAATIAAERAAQQAANVAIQDRLTAEVQRLSQSLTAAHLENDELRNTVNTLRDTVADHERTLASLNNQLRAAKP